MPRGGAVQVALQLPQFAASVLNTTHLPLQTVSPSRHGPSTAPGLSEAPALLLGSRLRLDSAPRESSPFVEPPAPLGTDAPLEPATVLAATRTHTFELASHS